MKTFGHVVGLAGVSLKLYPGEVLAIIGDNGAGKSTLIKCLSGALSLDEGEILMDGEKVVFKRQAVAVARAAAFGSKVVILDEPTAALGVRESGQVLALIKQLRGRGLPVILISHNMPHVFEVADRIHIQRLGRCAGVITPQSHTMEQTVAIMTGATTLDGPAEETNGRAVRDEGGTTGAAR